MKLLSKCALAACVAWSADALAQASPQIINTMDFSAVRTGPTYINAEESAWIAAEANGAGAGYGNCVRKHLVTWLSGPFADTPTASATVTCTKDLSPPPPPPPQPPGEPPTVFPVQRSVDGANHLVSWRSNTGCNRHALNRSVNGGGWQEVYKGSNTSWQANVVTPATYQYKVLDLCYTAYHVWSEISSFVVSPAPTQPSPPQSSAVVGHNHTITWSAAPGADSYRLDRVAGDGWESVYIGPNTSWSVVGMPAGTYRYRVVACANGACSAPSGVTELQVVSDMTPIINYLLND